MIRHILSLLFITFFLTGCATKIANEKEMITVLDINNKLKELENRIVKTEKKVDDFSVIARAWAKRESLEFPIEQTTKLFSTQAPQANVHQVNSNAIQAPKPKQNIDAFLFIKNLDKKQDDFKRTAFLLKRNAIVYNKKGEEVLLLRKDTVVESSFRVNKYFQLDGYYYNQNYYNPNTELFISEEAFLD
jgi:hypothetical protein